ncbi:MAG: hypothetical protein ACREOZ_01830, partial [Gloeomargaritales cyanobacterium]
MRYIIHFTVAAIIAASCTLYTACKKNDCPSQPPVLIPPAHTALHLQATQVSTRWALLQWNNDSAAVSHKYILLRNGAMGAVGVDTVFNDTIASRVATVIVKDSLLTPSANYTYNLYRIYNNAHWDSANAQARTLDTTRDNYNWTVTHLGISSSVLYGVWGISPQSVWACGLINFGDSVPTVVHYYNGQFYYYDPSWSNYYSCYGTSDTDIYFGGQGVIAHFDGNKFTYFLFNGSPLPNLATVNFGGIWETPDR